MHAIITSIVCNPQPARLAPTMDALLRAAASGEYRSDSRTDFLQLGLEHDKLMFVTRPFLDSNILPTQDLSGKHNIALFY